MRTTPRYTKSSFTYSWHVLQETHDINHVCEDKESGNRSQQGTSSLNHSFPFREITGVICKSLSWYFQSFTWKTQPQIRYTLSFTMPVAAFIIQPNSKYIPWLSIILKYCHLTLEHRLLIKNALSNWYLFLINVLEFKKHGTIFLHENCVQLTSNI